MSARVEPARVESLDAERGLTLHNDVAHRIRYCRCEQNAVAKLSACYIETGDRRRAEYGRAIRRSWTQARPHFRHAPSCECGNDARGRGNEPIACVTGDRR